MESFILALAFRISSHSGRLGLMAMLLLRKITPPRRGPWKGGFQGLQVAGPGNSLTNNDNIGFMTLAHSSGGWTADVSAAVAIIEVCLVGGF